MKSNLRIAFVVFPYRAKSVKVVVRKMLSLVSDFSESVVLISDRSCHVDPSETDAEQYDINYPLKYVREISPKIFAPLIWIYQMMTAQLLLARQVFSRRHELDLVIFPIGSYYQLAILFAKVCKLKIITAAMGIESNDVQLAHGSILGSLSKLLLSFNYSLSDAIIVESEILKDNLMLKRYSQKIVNGALYLENLHLYNSDIPLSDREDLVGFIGRLSPVKGGLEFTKSIPIILEKNPSLKFLIAGTGKLDRKLDELLADYAWSDKIERIIWIEHNQIPKYLNRLKILVVPSYSEGIPNLVLEAFGCGTPVVATAVGGLPEIIQDGVTGFIIKSQNPNVIAEGVLGAISFEKLEALAENAGQLLEDRFSFEASRERYELILERVMRQRKEHGNP